MPGSDQGNVEPSKETCKLTLPLPKMWCATKTLKTQKVHLPKNILLERPTKLITTALWNLQDNLSTTDISKGHLTIGFIVFYRCPL